MKGLNINTVSNNAYIDASEWAFMQNAFIGANGIFNFKNNLAVSKISNNKVRLASGAFIFNGKVLIEENYFELDVDSGTLGVKRYDYIIAEYIKDGGSVGNDILRFRILKGTSSTGTPSTPTLINNATTEHEWFATLYINGTDLSITDFNKNIIFPLGNVKPSTIIDSLALGRLTTLSIANSATPAIIPMTYVKGEVGKGLTMGSDGVIIGSDIKYVLVSGQAEFYTASVSAALTAILGLIRLRNGNATTELAIARFHSPVNGGTRNMLTIAPTIIEVNKGDVIKLRGSSSGRTSTIQTTCLLTVVKLG